MSEKITWTRAIRPPAPMPCTARKAISVPGSCAKPEATEATTKMASASCTSSFRSSMSASLPQIGVLTVVASRVAVMIQVKVAWSPPSSVTMTGSEVDTTVVERIATSMPARSPEMASRTSRRDMAAGALSRGDELTETPGIG